MNVKKSLLVVGAVTTMGVAGITGMGVASAATNTTNSPSDGMSSLIDKLATKFNLNKDDVQAVFDEDRAAREAEHQQEFEQRLTQAVTDGKITEAQKQKILAKVEELKTQREANRDKFKSMTEDERRAAMKAEMESLKTWADENGISMDYLRTEGGMKVFAGPKGEGVRFDKSEKAASTNEN